MEVDGRLIEAKYTKASGAKVEKIKKWMIKTARYR